MCRANKYLNFHFPTPLKKMSDTSTLKKLKRKRDFFVDDVAQPLQKASVMSVSSPLLSSPSPTLKTQEGMSVSSPFLTGKISMFVLEQK
jgi:hypothetical protein